MVSQLGARLDVEQRQLVLVPALEQLVHLPERVCDVTRDVDRGLVVVVDLGRPEVDVHDLLRRALVPEGGAPLDQVVADRDHDIGLAQRHQDVVLALQPDREQAVRVGARDRALAHEGVDHADAGVLGQPLELGGGAFAHRAVAGEDQRVLGVQDDVERGRHRLVVGARPARLDRRERLAARLVLHQVLGQLDHHGAGLLGLGQLERLAHDLGDVVRMVERLRPLGDRPVHGDRIHVLVALLVEALGIGLAEDADQRRAVHVGVGDASDQVGRARPERAEADAGLAGQPAIGVGHERRGLLVAAQHELDLAIHQGNHHVGILLARNAEDVGHALGLETPHEEVRGLLSGPIEFR